MYVWSSHCYVCFCEGRIEIIPLNVLIFVIFMLYDVGLLQEPTFQGIVNLFFSQRYTRHHSTSFLRARCLGLFGPFQHMSICSINYGQLSTIQSCRNPLSKNTTSEHACFFSTLSLLLLNAKQGSCEYQFSKVFGLIRLGNRTQSTAWEADVLTRTIWSVGLLTRYSYSAAILVNW